MYSCSRQGDPAHEAVALSYLPGPMVNMALKPTQYQLVAP